MFFVEWGILKQMVGLKSFMISTIFIGLGLIVWMSLLFIWYNGRSRGVLDLWEAEIPNMVFVSCLWSEVWLGLAAKQFGW
jgi:hypothetical protein